MSTIRAAQSSDRQTRDRLFVKHYDELHRMARRELRRRTEMTLNATTLLHEMYMEISQRDSVVFSNAGQFMSYATQAMRGLIVDYIRSRRAQKRGGELEIISLPAEMPYAAHGDDHESTLIDSLNEALQALEKIDPRLAECVDLKFFWGLSFAEIAQMREVSERTVQRDWEKARLLLGRLMNTPGDYRCTPR